MGGIKDICMIFLFIWIGLTLFLGSMVVGINVILNLTSSLRFTHWSGTNMFFCDNVYIINDARCTHGRWQRRRGRIEGVTPLL